jgi:hypothetical protein
LLDPRRGSPAGRDSAQASRRDHAGVPGGHARARDDEVEAAVLGTGLGHGIAASVERKRANHLGLTARTHRLDQRDAVDRIAAGVDDEQSSLLVARAHAWPRRRRIAGPAYSTPGLGLSGRRSPSRMRRRDAAAS